MFHGDGARSVQKMVYPADLMFGLRDSQNLKMSQMVTYVGIGNISSTNLQKMTDGSMLRTCESPSGNKRRTACSSLPSSYH